MNPPKENTIADIKVHSLLFLYLYILKLKSGQKKAQVTTFLVILDKQKWNYF